ncbi:MAG: TetR/AcrR family transcriptional regulator [Polyangiaceae bacterium]
MGDAPKRLPRKAPRQERSRETVKAILDATEIVAKKHGIAKVTTRRVATVAGVSPGTLYQYYPTREALLVAVEERAWGGLATAFTEKLESVRAMDFEAAVEELTDVFVTEAAKAIESHGTLLNSMAPEEIKKGRRELVERVAGVIAASLAQKFNAPEPMKFLLPARLVVRGAIAFARLAVEERDHDLASGGYAREVGRMFSSYLVKLGAPYA